LLDKFNIKLNYATKNDIQDNFFKYVKHKIEKKTDIFRKKKKFLIEKKYLHKSTKFNNLLTENLGSKVFLEGHFESEKYFHDYRDDLLNEFDIKDKEKFFDNKYLDIIKKNNVVSICVRQNRFSERIKNKYSSSNIDKSLLLVEKTIDYINKAIEYFDKRIDNPKYLIWSNNFDNLDKYFDTNKFIFVINNKDKILTDFFLLTQCRYFIVGPSTFHWWGAWLSNFDDKICVRPKNLSPSNNLDFWPNNWISI